MRATLGHMPHMIKPFREAARNNNKKKKTHSICASKLKGNRLNSDSSNAALTWNQADSKQQTGCHLSG